jgi:hypothetical protein
MPTRTRGDLDSETSSFIARYLEVSALSTAISEPRQRIDYEAMVRQYSYPHPQGVQTRDDTVSGRHVGTRAMAAFARICTATRALAWSSGKCHSGQTAVFPGEVQENCSFTGENRGLSTVYC